ncbi:hypothetical protein CDAR_494461 [Caerostris darwini]|uniref:Uncharacterized protein n=1 Tax=Caerostris darwini TaxID=1538125 RepID=A0AAV4RWB7_9ARAC|nr:hypothetical protein CDAR_494461 [Caerostris darwini]
MEKYRKIRHLVDQLHWKLSAMLKLTKVQISIIPMEDITQNLINELGVAVWIRMSIDKMLWSEYIEQFDKRMLSSPEGYIKYVAYACYQVKNNTNGGLYERFINVCAIVFHVSFAFTKLRSDKYLQYTTFILIAFFESVFKKDFKKRGGFKPLENYLSNQGHTKWLPEMRHLFQERGFSAVEFLLRLSMKAERARTLVPLQPGKTASEEVESHPPSQCLVGKVFDLAREIEEDDLSVPDYFALLRQQVPREVEYFVVGNSAGETRHLILSYNREYRYRFQVLPDSEPATFKSLEGKLEKVYLFTLKDTLETEPVIKNCLANFRGRREIMIAVQRTSGCICRKKDELENIFNFMTCEKL